MTVAKVSAVESLNLENLQETVRVPGPCVSLFLPPYHPGGQAKSMAAILKTNLQEAARRLESLKISESEAADLLGPIEELSRDEQFLAGSQWSCALYRAPGILRQFELIAPVNAALTIGGCFQLRPILAELHLPPEFYLLKLSKQGAELLRCAKLQAETVDWPKGVEETLIAALALDQPDHDLENRSPVGGSSGAARRVRFGTGTERETQHTYLSDYYKMLDRGVHELLNGSGVPLVLAGVDEDTVIYRMANTYPNLLAAGVHGSFLKSMSGKDNRVLQQAYWIVRADCTEKAAAHLKESRERLSPARFSVHLDAILHSAMEGRVDRVYIDESAQRLGVLTDAKPGERSNWGEEDLLNRAAVETIRQGGLAFVLPNSRMPEGVAVAAILRY